MYFADTSNEIYATVITYRSMTNLKDSGVEILAGDYQPLEASI